MNVGSKLGDTTGSQSVLGVQGSRPKKARLQGFKAKKEGLQSTTTPTSGIRNPGSGLPKMTVVEGCHCNNQLNVLGTTETAMVTAVPL